MNKNFIISFLILWFSSPSFASFMSSSGKSTVYGGIGMIDHWSGKIATSATSTDKPRFYNTYTYFHLSSLHEISAGWSLSPEFYFSIPSKKSPDGHEKFSVYGWGLRCVYNYSSAWNFLIGISGMYYGISGDGGDVVQSNGASQSTFATPKTTETTSRLALDAGAVYIFDLWRLETSVLISNPSDSNKMSFNPMLTLTRGFL